MELQRWTSPDGSERVGEMFIDGALFHIHEDVPRSGQFSPVALSGTTVVIGLFAEDSRGREITPVRLD